MKAIVKYLYGVTILTTGMGMLSSCDNEKVYNTDVTEANVIGAITFDYEGTLPLALGVELPLNVKTTPELLSDDVIFTSTNSGVAYIDDNGTLHCVGLGKATVEALPSIGFGASASLTVEVSDNIVYTESMKIEGVNELSEYHYFGDEFQLTTVHNPDDHTYQFVEWKSSNPDVMTVDKDGNVICLDEGVSTITAKTLFPDKEGIAATLTFTVSPSADVEDLEIAPVTEEICLERPFDLDITYIPAYGNPATVEWESSDESIAYVDKGHVVPTGFGTVTLTGVCPNGKTSSVTITVTPGWHIWDASNKLNMWTAATSGASIEYGNDYVTVHMATSGSNYRADIKYACDASNPLVFHFGEYPVVALRTTIPEGGRNTFDVVDVDGVGGGNPQCNVGRYATGNPVELSDGSVLIYVDWGARTQYSLTGYTSFKTFQLKVADMVIADTPVDSYRIYWIRTFKSVEEMTAFAEAEVAAGR